MTVIDPRHQEHGTSPEVGVTDPALATTETLHDPGVEPGSLYYSVPESTAPVAEVAPVVDPGAETDDVSGYSMDTATLEPETVADDEVVTIELETGDEGMDRGGSDHTGEEGDDYNAPEGKPSRRGLKAAIGVGVVSLLAVGSAVAFAITKKGGNEEQVSAGPQPTAAPSGPAPSTPPTEAPKTSSVEAPKTTITIKQPVLDPNIKHFPMRESAKGSWPRTEFTEQGLGDFRMSATTQDLNTLGYNTSKYYKESRESLEVTDGDRQLVITVDARNANSIIAIRLTTPDASTDEGIKVGSTKEDLEKAYTGKLLTEKIINVDGEAEDGYVYVNPRGHKFVFEVSSDGKVEAINLRNPDFF